MCLMLLLAVNVMFTYLLLCRWFDCRCKDKRRVMNLDVLVINSER